MTRHLSAFLLALAGLGALLSCDAEPEGTATADATAGGDPGATATDAASEGAAATSDDDAGVRSTDTTAAADQDPETDQADDDETAAAADRPLTGIRLLRDEDDPWRGALQTSIVHYTRPDGERLDVVNVMHLGDEEYYAELERRFESYDAVLYEMIKAEGASPVRRPGSDAGMLSLVQKAMGNALGAVFQLDSIDYGKANFVHADLTAERFAELWEERQESIAKLMLRAMSAGSDEAFGDEVTPAVLFRIAKTRDKPRLRMILAEVFAKSDMLTGLTDIGPDGRDRSMLIGQRNIAALEISMRELAGDADKVALFYGAGHWPDLDIRLVEDHGFERGEIEWVTAWTIEPKPADGDK